MRAWPASAVDTPPENMLLGQAWKAKEGSSGPYVFVYELAGPASMTQVILGLGQSEVNGQQQVSPDQTAHVAVSSQSATSGFSDVGTYQLSGAEDQTFTLTPAAHGRWVRLTLDGSARGAQLQDAQITGTFDTRPASGPVAGVWKVFDEEPYLQAGQPSDAAGVLPTLPLDQSQLTKADSAFEIRQSGTQLNAVLCSKDGYGAYHGSETGNTVDLSGASRTFSPAIVNADGTVMVAAGEDSDFLALRMSGNASCASVIAGEKPQGSGAPLLLLFNEVNPTRYAPYGQPAMGGITTVGPPLYPGFRIVPEPISLFEPQMLAGYETVVLSAICKANAVLTKTQTQALTDWTYGGGKLIIHDSDDCTDTDYSFLPYHFTSSNPGPHAAQGSNFILVDSNTLGSDGSDKAHFVDVKGYLKENGQQLGDANTVVTQDRHWCGHLYGTNVLGQNGYFQMYAPLGSGLIIYDGLDSDDSDLPEYQRIVLLELQQPADATLPCSQLVSTPFTVASMGAPMFAPGKSQTLTVPIEMYASHGFSGSVKMSVKAPPGWQASLSNARVPLSGTSAHDELHVNVPAAAKPGRYPVVVTAADNAGNSASATVTVASAGAQATPAPAARSAPLPATPKIAKTLSVAKRVAVYGIYFDFASATLKPASTPVLLEIAQALRANPSWKITIEGHTDNVGGEDYNLDLSRRRAASVKSALVTRYGINPTRLSTVGYGFSRPKASNDTPQGRAANRRVELVRS